jgi:hypothetical protein
MAHVPDIGTTDGGHWVTNYLSGGGKNFNKVRALFNTGIPTRIIPPAVTSTLTNFTMIMVANCSNVVTASQEIYGNANNPPYLDFDASKLTINAGNNVTGPTTIASSTFYIITWKCNGASSEIDTNGVLYVSGDAGIKGTPAGAAPLIAHDRVNQFVGNICRVWTWTNQLNTVDLGNAINQCKTDFGF